MEINEMLQHIKEKVEPLGLKITILKGKKELEKHGLIVINGQALILEEMATQKENSEVHLEIIDLPIWGNTFFVHSDKYTVCTTSGWEYYQPPSVETYLIYAALRAFLVSNIREHPWQSGRFCLLDYHSNKNHTKLDLNSIYEAYRYRTIYETFSEFYELLLCEHCLNEIDGKKYSLKVEPVFVELAKRLEGDFEEYNKELKDYFSNLCIDNQNNFAKISGVTPNRLWQYDLKLNSNANWCFDKYDRDNWRYEIHKLLSKRLLSDQQIESLFKLDKPE